MKGARQVKGNEFITIQANCDCSYNNILRTVRQVAAWSIGPKCPGCGKTLGWMDWSLSKEDDDKVAVFMERKLQASCVRVTQALHAMKKEQGK